MSGHEPVETAVDELYRVPLDRFVPARTELARSLGKEAATVVRRLEKPSILAWALNQLFWRERGIFDRLVDAAARVRSEQSAALLGRSNALRDASAAHTAALSDARQAAVRLLTQSGHPATPDALRVIDAALEAVPWRERPGRLVRPPAAQGFGALAGMAVTDEPPPTPPSEATRADRALRPSEGRSRRTPAPRMEAAGRSALDAARAGVEASRAALSDADARASTAEDAVTRARQDETAARQALETAERTLRMAVQNRRRAEQAQDEAARERDAARKVLSRAEQQFAERQRQA
jgi:hypothetical protein